MYARGALVGMTCGTGRAQIIRAAVESIAYQCRDVVDAMRLESGQPIASLRADGGASACDFLMQFQADLLECRVERPTCIETTALGAASLAALALGWQTPETLAGRTAASVFTPSMPETQRNALLAGWRKAVSRAARWETES